MAGAMTRRSKASQKPTSASNRRNVRRQAVGNSTTSVRRAMIASVTTFKKATLYPTWLSVRRPILEKIAKYCAADSTVLPALHDNYMGHKYTGDVWKALVDQETALKLVLSRRASSIRRRWICVYCLEHQLRFDKTRDEIELGVGFAKSAPDSK